MNMRSKAELPCKVLIVEDHPLFREHLGRLISRDLGMIVIGERDNIRAAMSLVEEERARLCRVVSG